MTGTLNLPASGSLVGTDQLVVSDGSVGVGAAAYSNLKLKVVRSGPTTSGETFGLWVSNIGPAAGIIPYTLGAYIETLGEGDYRVTGLKILNWATNTTTEAAYKRGLYIESKGAFTGSGGAPTDNTGICVHADGANRNIGFSVRVEAGDQNYAPLFSGGNVGIGTNAPGQKLEVNGRVRLNTTTPKPTCDAATRGTLWVTLGGAGVADLVEVCTKDAVDAYPWRSVI